jgi:hypothetical protein
MLDEKQLTSVEWLQQEVILQTNLPLNLENVLVFNKLIEQAKEMEDLNLLAFGHFCRNYDLYNKDKATGILELLSIFRKQQNGK